METKKLLDEYPPVSTAPWEEAIRVDLKRADYARKLIWQTAEGLAVKPYYRAEDIATLDLPEADPNAAPHVADPLAADGWRIREEIAAVELGKANQEALEAVAAGAEEITFLNAAAGNASDLRLLLANLQTIPVHFEDAGEPVLALLSEWLRERDTLRISTGWNPLENLNFAAELLRDAPPALVPFTLDGADFGERGANAVEEAGFTLAAGIEFLKEMEARGVAIERAAKSLSFSFSIGGSYFFEIAKFRAFRMLWARAVESFGGDASWPRAHIHARTSRWNETIYDPHVNVLRATTEAMSAVLGGADSLSVAPFDECYETPDGAARRLARNTQIILKREAMLAQVADPAAGSYCIETITDFIAHKAWTLMQKIEQEGGYRKAAADGMLERALVQSQAAKDKAVASRRRVLTGTNQYANPGEKALDRIQTSHASDVRRGAREYERLRLRTERSAAATGHLPQILLAEFGDAKMRTARSGFAANFYACAGFAIATERFETADKIAAGNADLIVLCSSDQEYLQLAKDVIEKLKARGSRTPVIVAGSPECTEQLRAAGVADFIHVRSNPIDVLTAWQQRLGIKA